MIYYKVFECKQAICYYFSTSNIINNNFVKINSINCISLNIYKNIINSFMQTETPKTIAIVFKYVYLSQKLYNYEILLTNRQPKRII
jgi:hypothetical protein